MSPAERFNAKVEPGNNGCLNWTGAVEKTGYGRVKFDGRIEMAHRAAWIHVYGPIPPRLVIDHTCHAEDCRADEACAHRRCVNVDHMELVTIGENTRRGNSPTAIAARTGICKRGHSLTDPDNVKVRDGRRYCLECVDVRNAARRLARAS